MCQDLTCCSPTATPLGRGVKVSSSPEIVLFDVVKAKDQFVVPPELKHFYQAEVLVPSPIPPNLIVFHAPDSVDCKITADDVSRCPDLISACPTPVSACPNPVSTCPAPVVIVRQQEVKCKLQMKRYDDLSRCFADFAEELKKSRADTVQGEKVKMMKSTSVQKAGSDDDEVKMKKMMKCEMPLCDKKDSCADCAQNGPLEDCPKGHMILCQSPDVFLACDFCERALCSKHFLGCYCSNRFAENRLKLLENPPSQSSSSSVKKPLLQPPLRYSITKKPPGGPGKQQMLKR